MKKILFAAFISLQLSVNAQERNHQGHSMDHGSKKHHMMKGFYGSYPMTREASGTSWQPEATPHEGHHGMHGPWMHMGHGFATLVYDRQGGQRGDNKFFGTNMLMNHFHRPFGAGALGLRSMITFEPATIGRQGYPLILQTGETSDGKTPLIDRQHPHDLFMELAATYSVPLGEYRSLFGYIGLPGEPALGPPTFMHRFSGVDSPEAPLGHHWMDSTHITFGVGTLGYVWKNVKLEASGFKGREPDESRWNIESPKMDSYSGRLSYNPTKRWALQVSGGYLHSPEQLEPDTNVHRFTASAAYHKPWRHGHWQTTAAWGRNKKSGHDHFTDAYLLESALVISERHTFFGRAEQVDKDELFAAGPLAHEALNVGKASLGYIRDFQFGKNLTLGLGGLGSAYSVPSELRPFYGENPLSFMLFVRAKIS